MRVKLLTTISFFTYQLSISQTEKLLHGKVISQNIPLKNVEVINKTSRISTTTNTLGEFSILVNVKDSLIFFSKDYFFSRLKITSQNIETNNLVVNMILKPQELDEVVITKIKFLKIEYDAEAIAKINIDKQANDLTQFIPGYKDGSIRNAISIIIPMGGGKKEKDEYVSDFKKFIIPTCPSEFFYKKFKIKS